LGLGAVVAISISAMLGSGIFVLPGLAAAKTGPLVYLAYLIAGLAVLPAALSQSELATAMPTSGGTYIYLERTFGPLTGTISGVGLWLTMLLKSAFALVGFSAYLSVLIYVPLKPMALTLLVVVTILNILGVSIISKLQKFIVTGVLVVLTVMAIFGLKTMQPEFVEHGFSHGWHGFLAATAFVFVSYAGVTKIAAIAEEVKNPDRNLPWGILISWFIVMCAYVFIVFVLVANVPMEELVNSEGKGKPDLHPIHTLACIVGGKTAGTVAAILAVITMVSMSVAGLLAASRFPFAMSRDQLLPEGIKAIHPYFMTPVTSILLTAAVMGLSIAFLPVEQIAKLASAFMIVAFVFVCGTVIVLREIASEWYKPRFRSPLYPVMQVFGIVSGIVLLSAMGLTSVFAIGFIVVVGAASYFGYGQHQTSRQGVVAKMGKRHDLIAERSRRIASLTDALPNEAAVIVPLFGTERSAETLVEMGASLAHGRKLEVLHVTAVPEQIYLADALEEDQRTVALKRRIRTMAEVEGVELEYDQTVTRDVVRTIHEVADRLHCEWVVMEAAGRRRLGITFQNPLGWLQDNLPCNLAVFKDAGVRYIRQILVFAEPGPHDSLVVTTANHLAEVYEAELNFICFVADEQDLLVTQARADYIDQLRDLCTRPTSAVVVTGGNELEAIQRATAGYDLMIMGAAPNRTLLSSLWGTQKDNLTRLAECSVLWLKTPILQAHEAFDIEHLPVEREFDLFSFVDEECVQVQLNITKKEELFRKAAELLGKHYPEISPIVISSALWEREQLQNTCVGNGVAMPHATLMQAGRTDSTIAIFTTAEPIGYGTPGQEKVDVFFFTTGSPNNRQTHLKILAELSKLCLKSDFLRRARASKSSQEMLDALRVCLLASHGDTGV
jgi:amino acid transporter/mannitol/fructose-specific phosphotransferase system IIA component (Ntr-type)/nucleotide-binding universal stress UspA family protein